MDKSILKPEKVYGGVINFFLIGDEKMNWRLREMVGCAVAI
jgi:hypothetical protein